MVLIQHCTTDSVEVLATEAQCAEFIYRWGKNAAEADQVAIGHCEKKPILKATK